MEELGTVWAKLEEEVTLGDIGNQACENIPGPSANFPLK